jgi:hypothetical protein
LKAAAFSAFRVPVGKIRMISPFCKISTAVLIELREGVRAIYWNGTSMMQDPSCPKRTLSTGETTVSAHFRVNTLIKPICFAVAKRRNTTSERLAG